MKNPIPNSYLNDLEPYRGGKSKLSGIETSATSDQTGAEIKALYEVEANSYTDTKNTLFSQTLSTGFEGSPPVLSVNAGDNTKYDMTAGVVEIVNNSTVPATITRVVVPSVTAGTLTNLASGTVRLEHLDKCKLRRLRDGGGLRSMHRSPQRRGI